MITDEEEEAEIDEEIVKRELEKNVEGNEEFKMR